MRERERRTIKGDRDIKRRRMRRGSRSEENLRLRGEKKKRIEGLGSGQ
jgi:hypothetical protein